MDLIKFKIIFSQERKLGTMEQDPYLLIGERGGLVVEPWTPEREVGG